MIKSLVFHIGDPKNGSSSIQAAMQERACHCPTVRIAPQPETNASSLANSLFETKGSVAKREKQFGMKSRWAARTEADLGLISAEFFSRVRAADLQEALEEFMPEYAKSARVIAYVRPHAERFLSGYAQRLKVGNFIGSMDTFVDNMARFDSLNYTPRFSEWRNVFGARFTLRPFIRSEMQGGDVVEDFFSHALQGAPFELSGTHQANESLGAEELAAMRYIQTRLKERDVKPFLRLAFGGAMGRSLANKRRRYRTKLVLSKDHAARLQAVYGADAKALDDAFFERPLMQNALEAFVDKAAEKAPSLDASDYYSERKLRKMLKIADGVADRFEAYPHAWRNEYQRVRGQRFDNLEDKQDRVAKALNARHVWALINSLTRVMTPLW